MPDGTTNSGEIGVRTQAGLHRLVGYAELMEASGCSRSTIERAWRGPWDAGEPRLPMPGKIGSRAVWAADAVNLWLRSRVDWQCGRLAAMARVNPDELASDQIAPTLRQLGARLVADHIGEPVSAEQISLSITRRATNDEVTASRAEFIEQLECLCGHFDAFRAQLIAAAIFPALREQWFETFEPGALRDPEVLRQYAADNCLDDAWWAALQKAPASDDAKVG